MTSIENIIKVNVTRQTRVPTVQGFGSGAFVSDDAVFQGRVKQYKKGEIADDILAGAKATAFEAIYFSQEISVENLYIIKKKSDRNSIVALSFDGDFITGNSIGLTAGITNVTQAFDTDQATTIAALAVAIAADSSVNTAVVTGAREITLTGPNFTDDISVSDILITGGVAQATGAALTTQYADEAGTLTETLNEAVATNGTAWYGLAIYSRVAADILEVAAWAENGQIKLYMAVSNDANVAATGSTDIASQVKALGYDRITVDYTPQIGTWPEAAAFGRNLARDAGSLTWAYKERKGITTDELGDSEGDIIQEKNANIYTEIASLKLTQEGKVASGEFIDVIMGIDFIIVQMQARGLTVLSNTPKVPITDEGLVAFENQYRAVLNQAIRQNILAADPPPNLTMPLASSLTVQERLDRIINGIEFSGRLAGAAHKNVLNGTLSV